MAEDLVPYFVVGLGFIAITAAIPQLLRLLKLKSSREFTVSTWIVWLCYQLMSVIYSVQIKAVAFIVINTLWTLFYACMIALIIKYKPKNN